MKPTIVIYDEALGQIGTTFPRRAKALIKSGRAKWKNEKEDAIILFTALAKYERQDEADHEDDIMDLIDGDVRKMINRVFAAVPISDDITQIKQDCMTRMTTKLSYLIADGMNREMALTQLAEESEGMRNQVQVLKKKPTRITKAYRDEPGAVIKRAPIDIIKQSKKGTRHLHILASIILWTSTLVLFHLMNQLLGYTRLQLNPARMSWTWLIFIGGGFLECLIELVFSRKELEVLSETIDLRQINPHKSGDLDLKAYRRRLIKKIRIMTSCVVWIPLVLMYFISGYAFRAWSIAWLLIVPGALFEVFMQYVNMQNVVKSKTRLVQGAES